MDGVPVFHDLVTVPGACAGSSTSITASCKLGSKRWLMAWIRSNAEALERLQQDAERRLRAFNERGVLRR